MRLRQAVLAGGMMCLMAGQPSAVLAQRGAGPTIPTGLAVAVLSFRDNVVERTTPIDACSLQRLMQTPTDFAAAFRDRPNVRLTRRDGNPCGPGTPIPDTVIDGVHYEVNRGCARFESVELRDSTATVQLSVVKNGDASFVEEYKALRRPRDGTWVATEVTIRGLMFASFVGNPGC